jgi:hypothetical protein
MTDQTKSLKSLSFNTNVPHEVRTLAEAVSGLTTSVNGSRNGHQELSGRIAQIESRLLCIEQQLRGNAIDSLTQ